MGKVCTQVLLTVYRERSGLKKDALLVYLTHNSL